MIRRDPLIETVQEKVATYLGKDLSDPLFMRDIDVKRLNEEHNDRRLGIYLFFEKQECIYAAFSEDDGFCDEVAYVRSLLLGTKSFKDCTGRRWRTPSTPAWDAYLKIRDRPKSTVRRIDRILYLSLFSALFFPIDFAVDRLYWGATLIRILRPECNHSVHCDKSIRNKLTALVPDGCAEDQQISALTKEGLALDVIEDPSEQVQIAAVRSYPYALGDLVSKGITPSRAVIMAAAEVHGHAIELLDPNLLDEEILLAAVRATPAVISQIDSPSPQLQKEAITADPSLIQYISDPTDEVQVMAISRNPELFYEISKPCEDAKIAFLKVHPSRLEDVGNLSDDSKIRYIVEKPSYGLFLIRKGLLAAPIGSDVLREPITRELLKSIRRHSSHSGMLAVVEKLRWIGYDWPELDAVEMSMRAAVIHNKNS